MNLYQPTITGSLSVSGSVNISGSITIEGGGTISGTASIATTALTASFVANAQTASYVLNAVSSSFALTASSADNLLVRNTLTAQTLVVQTITSSVDFVTGSTRFGSSLSTSTHQFTGSVLITGSVGIGTSNPTNLLTISSGNGTFAKFGDNGYLSHFNNGAYIIGGAEFNSTGAWTARSTSSAAIAVNEVNAGSIVFITNTGLTSGSGFSPTERMRITSGGNVGIGTTNPQEILHISSSSPAIRIGGARTYLLQTVDTDGRFRIHDNTAGERFTIASGSGNVGIGTTSPLSRLDLGVGTGGVLLTIQDGHTKHITSGYVVGSQYYYGANIYGQIEASSTGFNFNSYNSANFIFNSGNLYIKKSDGFQNIIIQPTTTTAAAGTRFLSAGNDMYLFIDNSGGDYGPTGANGASFAYNANIRVVGNKALQIATNDTVRMTITSGGKGLFGTTTPSAGSNGFSTPSFQVVNEVISMGSVAGFFWENRSGGVTTSSNWYGWYTTSGTIYLYNGANNVANIVPSTGVYTATSDINKKKDFEPYTNNGLNAILGLKPTLYRMKGEDESTDKHLGFIAQEVKDYIPQAYVETIAEEKDGGVHIGLNYQAITTTLVKALQELKAEFDEYKTTHP